MRAVRCLTCHYDLRKLTERRCPECGRAFDPDDASTYFEPPTIVTLRVMFRVAVVCYVLNLAFSIYVSINEMPGDFVSLLMTPITAAFLLVFTFPVGIVLFGMFWLVRRSLRSAE